MSTETINELIQEIALKHRLILSPDDPLLVLQTINERLLQDSAKAQQAMLDQYKKELEEIKNQWIDDTKSKAERILNASLAASKEAMAKTMQEGANEAAISVRNEIDTLIQRISYQLRESKQTAKFNLFASITTLIAFICVVAWLLQ